MFLKSSCNFLPVLILVVYGYEDTNIDPVDALQVKHLLIDNYTGPLKYGNLKVFSNLEDLHLKDSHFVPFNASFLLALPKLKRLRISSSLLQTVDHDVEGCCTELQEFEMTTSVKQNLGEVEMKIIKAMKNLKRLVLHNVEIETLHDENFLSANISHLTLSGCGLRTINNNPFAKLQQLEELNLEFNFISDIKKKAFAPLTKVKMINLRGNFLESLKTDMIPPLPNLERLKVSYNRIEEINLEGIKEVAPKLKSVDINGNEVHNMPESGGVKLINYVDGIH